MRSLPGPDSKWWIGLSGPVGFVIADLTSHYRDARIVVMLALMALSGLLLILSRR